MKLAALGLVAIVLGVVLSSPGLTVLGGLWIIAGLAARTRVQQLRRGEADGGTPGAAQKPAADPRTFVTNTALFLVIGVPSLVVGILGLGIDGDHSGWRWLPIAVGGFATSIAVLGAVLYLTGSALTANAGAPPQHPATITIRAMRETGTYVNERPRLEFELYVEPDGQRSYEVTKKATVPFTAMGALRVGGAFRAKVVGPAKPTVMEIDWDAPVPAPGGGDVAARLAELDRLRTAGTITTEEYDAQRRRVLDSI